MDEKEKKARRFAQTKRRQDTQPPQLPQVRESGKSVNQGADHTSGLRNTQAALDLVKSKMRQDADTPESGAIRSFQEDGKAASAVGRSTLRSAIKRRHIRKLGQQETSVTFSDYTRHTSKLAKKNGGTKGRIHENGTRVSPPQSPAGKAHLSTRADYTAQVKASNETRQAKVALKKNAVKSAAAKKGTRIAAKGTAKAAGATAKAGTAAASGLAKVAIPVIAAAPIILILVLVIVIVFVLLSPLGAFFSDNEDNPHPVSEIVSEVNAEFNTKLADLRKQYEDQEYVVNVYYGVPDGDDGGKLDNWRDVITLYSLSRSDGEVGTQIYNDEDVQHIHNLYFDMNPISVDTWTETTDVETERQVEKQKYVYNPNTGKFEKHTYYENVTETETQTVNHADIWINNMRYVSKLDEYTLDEQQRGDAEFMLDYRHDPLWAAMGLQSSLSEGDFIGNVDDLIKNLPEGTKGAAIAEAALSRLGDPYSMDLRGQGNYIDCSGLSQWAYGLAGIQLPNTAADQAKWCVDNGKVIDGNAAVAGDLVFYTSSSERVKNQFMQVGHVGIYVGDGMMVDASSTKGCVVYRAVYGSPVLWARPHV